MSTFRDAITEVATPPEGSMWHGDGYGSRGDAILAMPEMQAIRTVLRDKFVAPNPVGKVDGFSLARGWQLMAQAGLPESVIDWVLEDQ